MIHAINIHNYRSIRDSLMVDLTVGKQAPGNPRYMNTASPELRVTKVHAFMGANASGKTTVLKAIALVKWLMTRSFGENHDRLPVTHFAGYKDNKPTVLEITFELDRVIHVYKVTLTSKKILDEELFVRTLTKSRMTDKRVFERKWNAELSRYVINATSFGLAEDFWANEALGNASVIATAKRFGNEYATKIADYWKHVETNIVLEDHQYRPYQFDAYMALRYYERHPKSRKLAEADIKKYDLGIEGFGKDGMIKHKYANSSFELEVDDESSGTQQLLVLRKKIESVLENGGVALIDELNAYLHPLMSKAIIEKFLDKKINKGGGQLLFSTHDIYVLDYLEKYEISLIDKRDSVTTIKRLDSYPGVRNTDNFKKKYLEGDYDAIPNITL